ncbi:MAG: ribosome-binding factor A [Candidatus Moraniibacteriota bacterium]
MQKKTLRQEKVNELIRQHISVLLAREMSFKAGILVTVAKVEVTPDLRQAFIGVSIFPIEEEHYVMESLRKELYRIQGALNQLLRTRPLPLIRFRVDATESKAQEVESLLLQIEREE